MTRNLMRPAPLSAGPAPLALSVLLVLLGLLPAASVADETGRPYLKRPAESPAALLRQVAGDPQLTARYAKHFRTPEPTVLQAFRQGRPISLPPGRYTIWLTGRHGLRYPTVQVRERETRAFLVALPFEGEAESWLEAGTGSPIQVFRPVEEVEIVVETPTQLITETATPQEILVPIQPSPRNQAATVSTG